MLIQLIYASAAHPGLSAAELSAIANQACARNRQQNLTGMLVYHDGAFLQVLEGDKLAIDPLYKQIEQDPRHSHIRLIARREIEEREFADWDMALVDTRAFDQTSPEACGIFRDLDEAMSDLSLTPDQAHQALAMFRQGLWRQKAS